MSWVASHPRTSCLVALTAACVLAVAAGVTAAALVPVLLTFTALAAKV